MHRIIARIPVRISMILPALFIGLMLSGCWTLSLNELYSDQVIVDPQSLDPSILGLWGDPDDVDEGSWQFLPGGGNSMRLIVREGHSSLVPDPVRDGIFEAYLVRLDGQLILDLFPEEPPAVNETFLAHIIPAHSFFKVELEGHLMRLSILDDSWLRKELQSGHIDIQHHETQETLVLTADTASLQAFLLSHADAAWSDDPEVMKRIE